MRSAAKEFEFERAAVLRDQVKKLKKMAMDLQGPVEAENVSQEPPNMEA